MNPTIEAWRRNHPRCRYCVYYYRHRVTSGGTVRFCCAKQKYFKFDLPHRGKFCRLFEPGEFYEMP